MDSQRIIINNYDLSTTSIETTTEVKGYTVVKAPKGPITPVLISANSANGATKQLKEVFGDWSVDYPELYEVVQYISGGYDVYVSAPYQKATVPVAYLTSRGVVPGSHNAEYSIELEKFVNGTLSGEDIVVDYITNFESESIEDIQGEYDTRYGHTYFGTDLNNLGNSYYPEYINNALSIKTNTKYSDLAAAVASGGFNGKFVIKNIFGKNLTFQISTNASNEYIINYNSAQVGKVYGDENYTQVYTDTTKEMYLQITGDSNGKIDKDSISSLASTGSRVGLVSYWLLPLSESEIKAVLFPKYPSERKTHIEFKAFSSNDGRPSTSADIRNDFGFQAYDTGVGAYGNTGTLGVANINLATGITNGEYLSQNMVAVYIRSPFKSGEQLDSITVYPAIDLQNGTREFYKYDQCEAGAVAVAGVTYYSEDNGVYTKVDGIIPGTTSVKNYYTKSSDEDLHNLGWEAAAEDEYSDVDIFFDSSRHSYISGQTFDATNSYFFTLANQHKLSGYIFNYTIEPEMVRYYNGKLSYGYNYWNICNEAKITDNTKGTIWSPMTGSRAKMQSDIIRERWGGVAPMYLNSSGLGGQLAGMAGVNTLRYTYKKDVQMLLDDKNFNPVIKDANYGIMVIGQKTCKADDITDYSYIGHVSAFLNFEKEVKINVMIPQLGKANNDYYRTLRAQQMEALLAKRLQGANRIWAAAQVDTSTADGCNDAAARKARKFVINTKVKVDIFSEFVELNFVNVDQETVL